MFELLKNKNTIILISIVILLGILFFMNNKKEKENYSQVSCSREVMSDIPKEASTIPVISQPIAPTAPTTTSNGKIEFRVYYTNWCGWSKRALALLNSEDFKTQMKKIEDKAILVLLDCEDNGKEQCDKEKIQGFPTMKLSKNGELIEFNGPRTTEGIISFIKEHF